MIRKRDQRTLEQMGAADAFISEGYAFLSLDLQAKVEGAIVEFSKFIEALPSEEIPQWHFIREGLHYGYVHRAGGMRDDGEEFDYKHLFEYRPYLHTLLDQAGINPAPYATLLKRCGELYALAFQAGKQLLHELDVRFNAAGIRARFDQERNEFKSMLRLIKYDALPALVRSDLANTHLDRSFFTLHLGENGPGMFLTDTRVPYVQTKGKTLVFPGRKAEALTNGIVKALPHGVRNHGGTKPRESAVFFMHVPVVGID